MFKGYIFDWDNTLIDSLAVIKGAVSDTLDAFEFTGDRDKIMLTAGVSLSLREGFPIVFGDKWQDAGAYFYQVYSNNIKYLEKKKGYDAIVKYIRDNNIPCAVNSNKKQELLELELKYFDSSDVFDMCVGAGVMKKDKPSPQGANAIMQIFAEKYNVQNDVCYVGDSATDIKCGRNTGIVTVLIGDDADAIAQNPDYHYDDLNTFLDVVCT